MWSGIEHRQQELERIVWAITVNGPAAIFRHKNLALYRKMWARDRAGFMEIAWALQESGMDREDAVRLAMPEGEHPAACACWRCVHRLHAQVLMAWARRQTYEEKIDAS